MDLINLIVVLILVGLAFWVLRTLGAALNIPESIVKVVWVLIVVGCVLYLLQAFGLYSGGPLPRVR